MKTAAARVLLFSSIGHALMHLMTAFYAVIVLTLAAVWQLPVERLLELYAPATVLLGIMSLPAGWASDKFGAPVMMVVMFVGMGLSSIACGLVPTGDTLALSITLCGIGAFGAIYHSVGIGWVIRTAKEQGHAMGVNGLWGSAGLALYGVVPGVLITLASWRAAFIVPGVVCLVMGAIVAWQMATKRIGDRPMPATPGIKAGRAEFWRVFSVLSVTMALEGVIWQAVMFGSALVFETRFQATSVLWLGLATSMIYVISGFAQYGLGRRIIDRYPLKNTYVIASALQVVAMLGLAMGNGYMALAGAIFSAVLSAAAGPVENILIARYTPSKYHGLGFGAKFVVAFGASPLAILLIARVREATGTLDLLFLGLAGASVVITAVALLLPTERSMPIAAPVPQPAE
ncbi:MAG: MFS transporter [Reyranella sp.]|uniref:MFS transporter n=1 Tax=Reyranella sp. TaxID=1929291 RepID=UPI001AC02674|nr:MFS transporter [Reyranella sp.]MBN9088587.1 MFS transporter [Reyranella sp.]